jgi:hypothetical protein
VPVMEGPILRTRLAGGGCKPPQGASVKSRGAERCGKGGQSVRQVWAKKTSESDPLTTCRNHQDDIRTGLVRLPREKLGGYLPTARAVSGMEVA